MASSIGFDSQGDEHLIPDGDDPTLHKADPLCGCNPDAYNDDGYESFRQGRPAKWFWSHYSLEGESG